MRARAPEPPAQGAARHRHHARARVVPLRVSGASRSLQVGAYGDEYFESLTRCAIRFDLILRLAVQCGVHLEQ